VLAEQARRLLVLVLVLVLEPLPPPLVVVLLLLLLLLLGAARKTGPSGASAGDDGIAAAAAAEAAAAAAAATAEEVDGAGKGPEDGDSGLSMSTSKVGGQPGMAGSGWGVATTRGGENKAGVNGAALTCCSKMFTVLAAGGDSAGCGAVAARLSVAISSRAGGRLPFLFAFTQQ